MKNNKFISFAGVSVIIGIIALALFIFLPAITINDTNLVGYEVIFGFTTAESWGPFSVSFQVLEFSFQLFLVILLTIAAVIFVLISTILPSKLVNLIVLALFAVNAVLIFIAPEIIVLTDAASNLVDQEDIMLSWEAIVSGVLFSIAGIIGGYGLLKNN